nr:NYN domain-containing protein [Candidatus Sigynarchaeota archaeon]
MDSDESKEALNEEEEDEEFSLSDELLQMDAPERKKQENESTYIPDIKAKLLLPQKGGSNDHAPSKIPRAMPRDTLVDEKSLVKDANLSINGSIEPRQQEPFEEGKKPANGNGLKNISTGTLQPGGLDAVSKATAPPQAISKQQQNSPSRDATLVTPGPRATGDATVFGQLSINLNKNDVVMVISEEIKRELAEKIKNEMHDLAESIKNELLKDLKERLTTEVISNVKYQIEYEMRNKYQDMIINWSQGSLKPQIKEELKFSITRDIKNDLEKDFLNEIKADLLFQVKKEILDQIKDNVLDVSTGLKQDVKQVMDIYVQKKVDVEIKKASVQDPVHLVFVDFNNLWELAQKFSFTRRVDIEHLIKLIYSILGDGDENIIPNRIDGYVFFSKYHECEITGIKDYTWPDKPLLTELMTRFKWIMVSDRKMGQETGYRDIDITLAIQATRLVVSNAPRILTLTIVSGDGDFTPLLTLAKENGIHTIVVAFKKGISSQLMYNADEFHYMND